MPLSRFSVRRQSGDDPVRRATALAPDPCGIRRPRHELSKQTPARPAPPPQWRGDGSSPTRRTNLARLKRSEGSSEPWTRRGGRSVSSSRGGRRKRPVNTDQGPRPRLASGMEEEVARLGGPGEDFARPIATDVQDHRPARCAGLDVPVRFSDVGQAVYPIDHRMNPAG